MLMYYVLWLGFVSVSSKKPKVDDLKSKPTASALLEFVKLVKGAREFAFADIPDFVELAKNERRDLYVYEQTIIVRDTGLDGKTRRCEVIEVE